jgi:hypothetical protein
MTIAQTKAAHHRMMHRYKRKTISVGDAIARARRMAQEENMRRSRKAMSSKR